MSVERLLNGVDLYCISGQILNTYISTNNRIFGFSFAHGSTVSVKSAAYMQAAQVFVLEFTTAHLEQPHQSV